jgi:hypothetical protein
MHNVLSLLYSQLVYLSSYYMVCIMYIALLLVKSLLIQYGVFYLMCRTYPGVLALNTYVMFLFVFFSSYGSSSNMNAKSKLQAKIRMEFSSKGLIWQLLDNLFPIDLRGNLYNKI